MSLGKVIQDLGSTLEALKQINATAPVPQGEQAVLAWAVSQLRERFPGRLVTASIEVGIYSTGDPYRECGVYASNLGHHKAPKMSEALAKLVAEYQTKTAPKDEAAVLPVAVSEAVEEATLLPTVEAHPDDGKLIRGSDI